jgi:ATP-binding cassette subfamily B protein
VQIWNQSFVENLRYSEPTATVESLGNAIQAVQLSSLLHRFSEGLASPLGDSGTLVSGGEGQRVRIARALAQTSPRLLLFDEPTRGLPASQRQQLLNAARQRFAAATLLCVTHDLESALHFPRVLVIDGGQLVEDGVPAVLASQETSRFAQLLREDRAGHRELWQDSRWRRLWVRSGQVSASSPEDSEHSR